MIFILKIWLRKIKSIPVISIEKILIDNNKIMVIEANLALGLNLNLISSKKPIKNKPTPNTKYSK